MVVLRLPSGALVECEPGGDRERYALAIGAKPVRAKAPSKAAPGPRPGRGTTS